jgi:hypothetical protein
MVKSVDTSRLIGMTIGCADSPPAKSTDGPEVPLRVLLKNRIQKFIARIAQLVEHDLAKVGVASSSLVSRSFKEARMVESVDTQDLKSCDHWLCGFKSRSGYFK